MVLSFLHGHYSDYDFHNSYEDSGIMLSILWNSILRAVAEPWVRGKVGGLLRLHVINFKKLIALAYTYSRNFVEVDFSF